MRKVYVRSARPWELLGSLLMRELHIVLGLVVDSGMMAEDEVERLVDDGKCAAGMGQGFLVEMTFILGPHVLVLRRNLDSWDAAVTVDGLAGIRKGTFGVPRFSPKQDVEHNEDPGKDRPGAHQCDDAI